MPETYTIFTLLPRLRLSTELSDFALPTFKSEFGGFAVKAIIWILAPILTGLGFAVGPKM